MGNLRIAYLHNLLADWLGDDGDIVDFRCEFRGLNMATTPTHPTRCARRSSGRRWRSP